MRTDFLSRLQKRYGNYRSQEVEPLQALLTKYRDFRSTALLDAAVVATHLSIDQIQGAITDPLVAKAIRDTNPGFQSWAPHSTDEWEAIVNSAKGKYFEYLVAAKLNDGETVGDVVLPEGFKAVLADSQTQPGWDVRILDSEGHLDEYLQLKVTDSASYIHEALTRYPDIKILATSEVADTLRGDEMILDAGMSEETIRNAVEVGLGHGDGFLSDFWNCFHPVIPLMIIASMQGYNVVVGKRAVRDAIEVGSARTQRAVVTAAVGALAKALGLGWCAIPAALLAGFWVTDMQSIEGLIAALQKGKIKLALQAESYRRLEVTNGLA